MVEFRNSADGSGNNAEHPDWNQAVSSMIRLTSPDFGPDGGLRDGPNPRVISNVVSGGDNANNKDPLYSGMVYAWGQFLDHDLDLNPQDNINHITITFPDDDPVNPGQVIDVTRGVVDDSGVPQNNITGWLDLSQVYGSDQKTLDSLRDDTGRLKVSEGNNLPRDKAGGPLAGDIRVGENPDLLSLQTLFARNHNRIVTELEKADPTLTPDELFQQARALNTAQYQNIIYSEYLPILLGGDGVGPYTGYDPSVDPRVSAGFAGGAFRVGHTQVSEELETIDKNGNAVVQPSLDQSFFVPIDQALGGRDIGETLLHLASDHTQATDTGVVNALRNLLADPPDVLDLAAINILRGRDFGLPRFNDFREQIGLPRYDSISQISTDQATVDALTEAYGGDVDAIDFWVGGIAENHSGGGIVGETFANVIDDQFFRVRVGDRFFSDNQGFDQDTLDAIHNTTLADIMRENTDAGALQENVFVSADRAPSDQPDTQSPQFSHLVVGTDTDKVVEGGVGDDTIAAGNLMGQILMGGLGNDVFQINRSNHRAVIADFTPGADKIRFEGVTDFGQIRAVPKANAMQLVGDGNIVTVTGLKTFTPDDVVLAHKDVV